MKNYQPTPIWSIFVVGLLLALIVCVVLNFAFDAWVGTTTHCAGNWSDYCQGLIERGLYVRGQ